MKIPAKKLSLWASVLFLFAFSLILYWQTTGFDFVWDDERTHLTANVELIDGNTSYFWTNAYEGLYIPVAYTAWSWITRMAQYNPDNPYRLSPGPYHFANICIHAVNGVLAFVIILLIFENVTASVVGALLFIVHPMQVESVAWISEFRGLLSGLFVMAGLVFHLLYRRQGSGKVWMVALSAIFFMLAMLSKPSAIVFPAIVWILDFFHFRIRGRRSYIIPGILILLALPLMVITKLKQPNVDIEFVTPLWQRFFVVGDSLAFYLNKLIWPFDLAGSYGRVPQLILDQWWVYVMWLIPVVILYICWRLRKQYPWLLIGMLIILVAVLPVSGIVPFFYQKFSTVADRYVYLAILGLAMILSSIYLKVDNKLLYVAIITPFLLLFTFLNIQQQQVWQSDLQLWTDALEKYPNQPHAYNNRGIAYHDNGQYQHAVLDYTEAIRLNTGFVKAYANRANSLAFQRKFDRALQDYTRAIAIDPDYANAYYNRAVTYFQTGQYDKALNDMQKAEQRGYHVNPMFKKDLQQKLSRR